MRERTADAPRFEKSWWIRVPWWMGCIPAHQIHH